MREMSQSVGMQKADMLAGIYAHDISQHSPLALESASPAFSMEHSEIPEFPDKGMLSDGISSRRRRFQYSSQQNGMEVAMK